MYSHVQRPTTVQECQFGKQFHELGSSWPADLGPPFGVMYCIRCECVPIQKKRRIIAKVHCRNIKSECPSPSCEEPVLYPGRCCKSCPGDLANAPVVLSSTAEDREIEGHQPIRRPHDKSVERCTKQAVTEMSRLAAAGKLVRACSGSVSDLVCREIARSSTKRIKLKASELIYLLRAIIEVMLHAPLAPALCLSCIILPLLQCSHRKDHLPVNRCYNI
uniref:VWFC domain-containing protein n=1 Tax=Timema douglasi TaxID=61478 RepID=A0A7R8VMQ5_TIMDO|nr:unnamed protein product [Timema douglasi]